MCTLPALAFMSTVQHMMGRKDKREAEKKAIEDRDHAERRAAYGMAGDTGPKITSPAQRATGISTLRVGGGSGGGSGGGANLTTGGGTSGSKRKSMKVRPTGRYV